MSLFQFIVVAVLCWTISVYAVDVETLERDHVLEKILAQIPAAPNSSEPSLISRVHACDHHENGNLRVEGCNTNSPVLPGYLIFQNYGSDTTCAQTNLNTMHVRRMNECFYGMKYTVGVTAQKNYGLNILYFQDSSCKIPSPSQTQTFYLPKNQCVGGMKFYTIPDQSGIRINPGRKKYALHSYFKFQDRCENIKEPSKAVVFSTLLK